MGKFINIQDIIEMNKVLLEKILSLNLEKWTIISFVVIGYFLIYKTAIYSTLGISWYISNISPLQVVFGSIKLIFIIITSFVCIFILLVMLKKIFSNVFTILLSQIVLMVFFLFLFIYSMFVDYFRWSFLENFLKYESLDQFALFLIVSMSLNFYFEVLDADYNFNNEFGRYHVESKFIELIQSNRTIKVEDEIKSIINDYNKFPSFKFVLVLFLLTLVAGWFSGFLEAKRISNNYDYNVVTIKNDNKEWFVVDYVGDKVLLIQKTDELAKKNIFKIVEYKEVEVFTAEKYYNRVYK
jgi:hypothetical protein